MSTNDFATDDLTDETGNGPAELRKALKDAQKQLKEANERLSQFAAKERTSTVEGVLKEAGVRASIAKYIPSDISDADGVTAWLKENAEDFGIKVGEAKSEPAQNTQEQTPAPQTDLSSLSPELQELFRRMSATESAGEPVLAPEKAAATLDSLKSAGSFDKAVALLAQS